jgi:uracil-DNA glycosylase family protein
VVTPAHIPSGADLDQLVKAARKCTACELYRDATQTVFGEGPTDARVVLVGEQPGDVEDVQGRPFVGPAGALLDRALEAAGLERDEVYLTNAVKHFRFTQRGKRRIHDKPGRVHIEACHPWLDAELNVLKPQVVVCLGATAVSAVLGSKYKVTKDRGELLPFQDAVQAVITTHPSAVLRMRDGDRKAGFEQLVDDLAVAAQAVGARPS